MITSKTFDFFNKQFINLARSFIYDLLQYVKGLKNYAKYAQKMQTRKIVAESLRFAVYSFQATALYNKSLNI